MPHPREPAVEASDEVAAHLLETPLDIRVVEVMRVAIEEHTRRWLHGCICEYGSEHDRVGELEAELDGQRRGISELRAAEWNHACYVEQHLASFEEAACGVLGCAWDNKIDGFSQPRNVRCDRRRA